MCVLVLTCVFACLCVYVNTICAATNFNISSKDNLMDVSSNVQQIRRSDVYTRKISVTDRVCDVFCSFQMFFVPSWKLL